ncbi:MAG: Asp-tRNA(Asn)/Glu-tRNA(Gln) amidotransferase GatCAB subunit A [Legionellales bacterium]|nr:Asp-tRNA(Asn)/Glu-tRNA(Gln) amidotransferase GatCAB subunit A [Legionellales bacterium]|tara:strand:- start:87479 stop:88930 length:1452 start_codon:yes stop_codon:yes gene_type:complete
MHTKTLQALASALADKSVSSVELTEHFLKRCREHNDNLNSFITLTEETALAQAKAADDARAKGNAGPLTGIPFAQKDLFCTKGIKTTCASKMLDNFIAPYDATLVTKCQDAGLVSLGKTNMDEFAMGSSNENSHYGAVKNPWDTARVPGGSSGGSAAAVAARLVPAASGTDTGGSIRQPASFSGITGIKPTYGRVSRYGMIAFASSLDQGGVFTQTAEDAALLMNVIAGFDPKDSTSADVAVPDYAATLNDSLHGLKIGLPKEYFAEGLDSSIATIIENAAKTLEQQGASVTEISLPNTPSAIPVYYVIAPAECSSNLSRFDGVRYGYRCEAPNDLEDLYKRSRGEGFGAEVKRRIMIGTYALSAGYYDAYYLKAQQVRRMISNDFQQAFNDVDVILGPTCPTTAFKLGEKTTDPVSMYLNDIYTISTNLAGLPGMSIPAGFVDGMPVGMQLIGNHFSEAKLLNIGHQFQQVTDWHQQMPEGF